MLEALAALSVDTRFLPTIIMYVRPEGARSDNVVRMEEKRDTSRSE